MIKKIVILGSGCGGTIVANKLRRNLPESDWQITIIDHDENHHYQPGWLFIPFGIYSPADCIKPKREFIPAGVDFKLDEITRIDPKERRISTKLGHYDYDWLIVSTGCRIAPQRDLRGGRVAAESDGATAVDFLLAETLVLRILRVPAF